MRRLFVGLVAVLSLSLITAQLSVAAVTPGTKCSKAGSTSTYNGKKYTCVKSGKKLVWNKGVAVAKPSPVATPAPTPTRTQTVAPTPSATPSPTPTSSPFVFTDVCQKDPEVPSEWATYQEFALKIFKCARPYRFLEVKLPDSKPTSVLTAPASYQPIAECKLPTQNNSNNLGFVKNGWQFNGDLQIQVIPVEFTDFKSSGSPAKEYGKYLDYIKEMFFKLSDGNTRITFKTPESFIQLSSELQSYVVPGVIQKNGVYAWKQLDVPRYQKDIFNSADKVIDFKGSEMGIVLVPLSVPSEYIAHGGGFRMSFVGTAEGTVRYNYLMPPASEVDNMSWFGVEPFLHLHEIFHATGQLEDHYGDDGRGPNLGTGRWGAMSGMLTDFILWDKWLAGMLRDSQVICGSSNQTGTYWIKPASYSGIYEKLLVVPISSTRAIVIESERAAGLNFKLSPISEGALVYTIDTLDTQHGSGVSVIRPSNRTGPIQIGSFILADAPLKSGESLTVWGYKITVVESGNFGDVIKVEKV